MPSILRWPRCKITGFETPHGVGHNGRMSLPSFCTDRVLFRSLRRDDVDAVHSLWTAPEVRHFLWDDIVITRDAVQEVVESHLATVDQFGLGFWALHIPPPALQAAAPVAGFCGFRFIEDCPEIELLYGLRGEHWGKGLGTEACAAALGYLWRSTSYRQVYARTDPPNYKSVQVMLRLGMTHQSTTASAITYMLRRPG
jgi:ribosomal-protein-alanine N-acetyltransferase